jgi:CubicO group peptidase (beta-lactamase class C family)
VHCSSGNLGERIEYQLKQINSIAASSTNPVGPVPRAPGDKFDYSNLNFMILEDIIEVLSGQSYENYVLKHVFPSSLSAPRLFRIGPYDASSGEAKHYTASGSYAEYSASNTCENEPPGVGAGGWAMSAKDLLRHLTRVDGVSGDVLTADSRKKMLTASAVWPTYARGWILGSWGSCNSSWSIVQGHNGGLSGAFSSLFLLPNGMSFALVANQDATAKGSCRPVATGGSRPAKVACGGKNEPACGDEPVARLVELLGKISWPSYDLF